MGIFKNGTKGFRNKWKLCLHKNETSPSFAFCNLTQELCVHMSSFYWDSFRGVAINFSKKGFFFKIHFRFLGGFRIFFPYKFQSRGGDPSLDSSDFQRREPCLGQDDKCPDLQIYTIKNLFKFYIILKISAPSTQSLKHTIHNLPSFSKIKIYLSF